MKDCIFCKIVKGEIPSVKVYENDRVLAFEDINPLCDGHTLIIPKVHAENIFELSAEDLAAIHTASKKLAHAIKKTFETTGIAFLQLNGKGVNQAVMHYHMHLLPRIPGSPEISLTRWDLIPGDMTKIKKIGSTIASAVK
ncbi:MAG: HIT family protein [Thermodesulfobacteriota bacterium]